MNPVRWASARGVPSALMEQVRVKGDLPKLWNYLVYLPCAGGLSAVNAIGTQLRDPMNSILTR